MSYPQDQFFGISYYILLQFLTIKIYIKEFVVKVVVAFIKKTLFLNYNNNNFIIIIIIIILIIYIYIYIIQRVDHIVRKSRRWLLYSIAYSFRFWVSINGLLLGGQDPNNISSDLQHLLSNLAFSSD